MPRSEIFSLQHSDLNDFLFAEVGTEPNGMFLTVSSVFARLGQDPWREAGRLATLPAVEAEDQLAKVIAGMWHSSWALPAARVIAARLVPMLPRRPAEHGSGAKPNARHWHDYRRALDFVFRRLRSTHKA